MAASPRRHWLLLSLCLVGGLLLAASGVWASGWTALLGVLAAQPLLGLAVGLMRQTRVADNTGAVEWFSLQLLWWAAAAVFLLLMVWPVQSLRQSGSLANALWASAMFGVFLCAAWRFSPFLHFLHRQRGQWASHLQAANGTETFAWPTLPIAIAVSALLSLAALLLSPQGLSPTALSLLGLSAPLLSLLTHYLLLHCAPPAQRVQSESPKAYIADAPLPIFDAHGADAAGSAEISKHAAEIPADSTEALFEALRRGQVAKAIAALDEGADPHAFPEASSRDQRTPVMLASLLGDMRVLRRLIELGVDLNTAHGGMTPLLVATRDSWHGRPDAVMTLLANGADPRSRDSEGNTALHHAARSTDPGVAALLLDAGAAINTLNDEGWNALGIACEAGNWRLAKFLLDRRGQPEPEGGQPALLACAQSSDDDAAGVQLLLRHKAKVDARGTGGRTALMLACANGHLGMASALLDAHADADARDEEGLRPLHHAARNAQGDAVQLLLRRRIAVDACDHAGRNALIHVCIGEPNLDVLRLLLAAGVDAQARDVDGRRALEHALGRGLWPLVAALDPTYPLPSAVADSVAEAAESGRLLQPKTTETILIETLREHQFEAADSLWRMDPQLDRLALLPLMQDALHQHDDALLRWLLGRDLSLHVRIADGGSVLESVLDDLDIATLHLPLLLEHGQSFTGAGLLARWLRTCQSSGASAVGEGIALQLLERGADAFGRDAQGDTPLVLAIAMHRPRLVDALLRIGVDPNQRDARGFTPLHRAAEGEDVGLVRQLIRYGANPAARAPDGSTPLGIALMRGHRELARWLEWEEWALPGRPLRDSDLPAAAMAGDAAAVERLLALGLPLDTVDAQGCSALLRACGGGREAVVALLLERGADTRLAARTGATPLSAAISMRHTAIVRRLLDAGADTEQRLPGGVSPLMLAAALGLPDILQELLRHHADVDPQDEQGLSALHCAALFAFGSRDRARTQAAFDVLLLAGADVEAVTHQNQDALLLLLGSRAEAGATCDEELLLAGLERLLQEDLDLDHQDGRGNTALHLAAQHGLGRIVQRLLREGADRHKRDALGRTPHDIALMRGFIDIASEFEPSRSPSTSPSLARFLRDRP